MYMYHGRIQTPPCSGHVGPDLKFPEPYNAAVAAILSSPSLLSTHSLCHSLSPLHSFSLFSLFFYMVGTRPQNKGKHPAAPVMSEAAKVKAGIKSAKRRTKKPTKDEQIRQLQARLDALENPDQTDPVSNEPLVNLILLFRTQR